ncbi:MAG: hypothetical protein EOO92_23105 [Pedobacter sp.]|nr:MAG: hypothetical protein EOO92_23105 [Pedobacter sp.]
METLDVNCYKCNRPYTFVKGRSFTYSCPNCHTEITSTNGEDVFFDMTNYKELINKVIDKRQTTYSNIFSYTIGISVFVLLISSVILMLSPTQSEVRILPNPNKQALVDQQYRAEIESSIAKNEQAKLDATPCIIQSNEVTFDQNFNPTAKLRLSNQSTKEITQVVLKFDFSDMSQWENTSVSRYLAEKETSYLNLDATISPGTTEEGTVTIPLPSTRSLDSPKITIVKVRYYDGTIEAVKN